MSIKNRLIVVMIGVVILFLFMIREEFSEGIWFSKVKPVIREHSDIKYFIASDIHFLSNKINDKGIAFQSYLENSDSKQINYVNEITDAFIEEIKDEKPQFLILSGDLTSNGEKESHQDLVEKLKIIESYGTSVYVIPGNHDILNPWASGFSGNEMYKVDSINKEEFRKLYDEFGYTDAISYDRDTLSYLVPTTTNLWLLMLDTNLYTENEGSESPEEEGEITHETFEWIKAAASLAEKNNAKIITVMHHNIVDHCSTFNKGFTVNYNDKTLEKFRDNNLNVVLSGHIHIQDIASDNTDPNNKVYDIATSTLSAYPQRYGVVEYKRDKNLINYTSRKLQMDKWVIRNNITDKNLINFSEYSKKFFNDKSLKIAEKMMNGLENITEIERNEMIKVIQLLNERVFEGNDGIVDDTIVASEGYKLWIQKGNESIKNYIDSILIDNNLMDNEISIMLGE